MSISASAHTRLGLPLHSRIILAAGEFTPSDGMRMAAWAFGTLKYVAPGWHLVLCGDGPYRESMRRFAHTIGIDGDDRIHFLRELPPLAEACVVWGTHSSGGVALLRSALQADLPVVAMRTADTETLAGAVFSPLNDPVTHAKLTRRVIANLPPRPIATVSPALGMHHVNSHSLQGMLPL